MALTGGSVVHATRHERSQAPTGDSIVVTTVGSVPLIVALTAPFG